MIKLALEKLNCDARLTLVVPTKLHNIRFFQNNVGVTNFSFELSFACVQISPSDASPRQNIIPGTVVDTCVVHPTWPEFYLNPHRAYHVAQSIAQRKVIVKILILGNCQDAAFHHSLQQFEDVDGQSREAHLSALLRTSDRVFANLSSHALLCRQSLCGAWP